MTIDEQIGILQAFRSGKIIQVKSLGGRWEDISRKSIPDWCGMNAHLMDYRIKSEPREWWICDNAVACVRSTKPVDPQFIHVREIIEP